jgi:PPOX class probable F420-dependent enzyme
MEMSATVTAIPDTHKDLLEGPVFVMLVTVMPDGQPQATPVWCSFDGTRIWINTAQGRQKARNMRRNPKVTVLAIDPKNPYRWLEVRGTVDEITANGALDHINLLSKLYRGSADYYAARPEMRGKEERLIFKIRPTHVNARG